MRILTILDQTRWDPDGDPAEAAAHLHALSDDITAVLTEDTARTIFESEVLGSVYVWAAAVHKTVNQQHPATPPDLRAMTPAAHLADLRRVFPRFHREQQELLAAVRRAYPDSGAS